MTTRNRNGTDRVGTTKSRSDRQGSGSCLLTVCRGCCCGTQDKHPDTDHAGQLRAIRDAANNREAMLRVSDCLDACEHSNVVVVSPTATGRRGGGRPTWLGEVLEDSTIQNILAWVAAGGPGVAELPDSLLARVHPTTTGPSSRSYLTSQRS